MYAHQVYVVGLMLPEISDGASRMDTAMTEIQVISASSRGDPVLFAFSAGHHAKTMITELMHPRSQTSKDFFIDAGTALDGFAGIQSRDFNSGEEAKRKYCKNIIRRDPGRIKFWLDPEKLGAVCRGRYTKDRYNNFNLSTLATTREMPPDTNRAGG